MIKKILLLLVICGSGLSVCSQTESPLPTTDPKFDNYKHSLFLFADTFLYFPIAEYRERANERFIPMLVDLLRNPNSFYDPLDTLRSRINIIYPEDSAFRIFNWEVKVADNIVRYYGAIQMRSSQMKLYPLFDYSPALTESPEDSALSDGKWYGSIIYRIKKIKLPDGNDAYMTFGINRAEALSNKKILDVLVVIDQKPIQWGIPFINTPEGVVHRYIIEYNKMANVSMNYDEERKIIYFDQTRSEINNDKVKYTQIPVGDYSGFRWNGTSWNFVPEIVNFVEYQEGQIPITEPKSHEKGLFKEK